MSSVKGSPCIACVMRTPTLALTAARGAHDQRDRAPIGSRNTADGA